MIRITQPLVYDSSSQIWYFVITFECQVFHSYKNRTTPVESGGNMIEHVFAEMDKWCEDNCKGEWASNTIYYEFNNKDDATLFRMTFI